MSAPFTSAWRFAIGTLLTIAVSSCSSDTPTPTPTEVGTLATEAVEVVETSTTTTVAPPASSWADIVERVRPSVVRIETNTCNGDAGVGSGFVMGDWIVTNRHVVDGYKNVVVVKSDGNKELSEQVRVSSSLDLALIKISSGQSLSWSDDFPRIGDEVAALGFPRGLNFSFTKGSISALDVRVEDIDGPVTGLIQSDAAVNPGNSGGPLIDKEGNVLGVVVLKRNDSEGLAFAIDGRQVQVFLSGQKGEFYPPCEDTQSDSATGIDPDVPSTEFSPETSPPFVDGPMAPEDVVTAFYEAVDARDFELAWRLGGRNLGKNPSFKKFAAGYEQTNSSQVTILEVNGPEVTVEVKALEQTENGMRGATYAGTYIVVDGEITSGKLRLVERES